MLVSKRAEEGRSGSRNENENESKKRAMRGTEGVGRWREGNNNGDNSDSIKHNVWTRRRKGGSEEGVLSMVRERRRVEEDEQRHDEGLPLIST